MSGNVSAAIQENDVVSIDLTGVAAAERTFAHAIDLEASDPVTVNIIDNTADEYMG